MPSREAGRLCPNGIFVPGNHAHYAAVSKQIFAIFERYTPWVEPVSIDEAFLDVSGATTLFGPPERIAEAIRRDIREELQLTASVGVAPNMFLAKLASDVQKPDGLTIVPSDPEGIRAFLDPLPVDRIWGVGKTTSAKLHAFGIHTVRDLREMSMDVLASRLGSISGAEHLKRLAQGEDDRVMVMEYQEKSISREHTYLLDEGNKEVLKTTLRDIADDVGRRLRADSRYATVGRLKIRWGDFRTATRQRSFGQPSCDDITFREMALSLLDEVYDEKPIRLIGFGVTGLQDTPKPRPSQGFLFDEPAAADPRIRGKREKLCRALDAVRKRHGSGAARFLNGTPNNP